MKKLLEQIARFGVVGVIAFVIDYAVLLALTELFGIHYLVSSAVAFLVSVIFNYILSIAFVFDTDNGQSKLAQFTLFALMSAGGLGINQLMMWLLSDLLHIPYQLSKLAATAVVMVYNFVTRKLFLERKEAD
ncbi:MAG: GtrA family protein [Oscillospiraceae bacterium]|nr:GtrA family protein [Oscillospiraceae bacterium]